MDTTTNHSREHLHASLTLGERIADKVAATMGSWRFIIGQSAFILFWILWNTMTGAPFDPFPWILLNLCMSTQAMYTGPLVMLSQNRQAARDRSRDDLEAREVDDLHRLVGELYTINQQQVAILHGQDAMLAAQQEMLQAMHVLIAAPPSAAAPASPAEDSTSAA